MGSRGTKGAKVCLKRTWPPFGMLLSSPQLYSPALPASVCWQEIVNKVHRAQKVIVKKKRSFSYVRRMQKMAGKHGQLARIRKLRVIRRTRFNSRIRVLDSFLLNTPLMRRLLATPGFLETMTLRNPRKQEQQNSSLGTWKSDTIFHRARRALLICGPASILTRITGSSDFFKCYPAWLRCCTELMANQELRLMLFSEV